MRGRINLDAAENVQLSQMADGVLDLNAEFVAAGFSPQILVSKNGELCKPTDDGSLVTLSHDAMAAHVRSHCLPGRLKKNDKGDQESDPDGETEYVFKERPKLPRDLVRAYMDSRHFRDLPHVKTIARAPVVRPDFTIRWEPGWDEPTKTWVTPGLVKDDRLIRSSFDLRTLFDAFPLCDRALVADCLAAAFTALISTAIDGALPAMIISARVPGSGKTELAILSSMLGGGDDTCTSWQGGGEFSKLLNSYVTKDQRVVIYDNIKATIDSPELEGVITNRTVSYRRMHSHTELKLRSSTAWFLTANGATVSPDMVRRSVVIMLDKAAYPVAWDPKLKHRVKTDQDALVTLMCHLIECWRDAGQVPGSVEFSNFEEWSRTISGILECAGIGGMFEAQAAAVAEAVHTDEDSEGAALDALATLMGAGEWTTGQLVSAVGSEWHEPAAGVLKAWIGPSTTLGAWGKALHKITGRSVAGSVIVLSKRTLRGKSLYSLSTTDGSALPLKEPSHAF